MTVGDKDSNVLLEVTDDGSVGSIVIPDTNAAPINTINKLYNLGGSLHWNGNPLVVGGSLVRWNFNDCNKSFREKDNRRDSGIKKQVLRDKI